MAREPVLAAGGIVLRRERPARVAVVRLRKRDEWVLPKGKLDDGETPREAAEREVLEETGHDVTVHEFLGTLAYESGGRSKIVHYWRMEAGGEQAYALMNDVRAVDWLPLDVAVSRLSRSYERAFLANVGPYALEAAALAAPSRKAKPPMAKKRRSRQAPAPKLPLAEPAPAPPQPQLNRVPPTPSVDQRELVTCDVVEVEPVVDETEAVIMVQAKEAAPLASDLAATSEPADEAGAREADRWRRSLAQKVRAWLGRAA
jgi:8-oxo-dGTP diphosphatase